MVCWLRFLKLVSDSLRPLEPNMMRRKRLAIDVLREIEEEKGHDVEKIRETIDKEGVDGLIKRAKRIKGGEREREGLKEQELGPKLFFRKRKKRLLEHQ